MTYFSKEFSAEYKLPDGSVATNSYEIDRYLKANNLANTADYSKEYFRNKNMAEEKQRQKEIFAEIVKQYKKRIWNE